MNHIHVCLEFCVMYVYQQIQTLTHISENHPHYLYFLKPTIFVPFSTPAPISAPSVFLKSWKKKYLHLLEVLQQF